MKRLILPFLVLSFLACNNQEKKATEQKQEAGLIEKIEAKHHKDRYYNYEMVQFDLHLVFKGKVRFDGTVYMSPDGGMVRMEDSSKVMIWDGHNAYTSDSSAKSMKRTRFDLLTWSYFFAAPYKLSDPGTRFEDQGTRNLNGTPFNAGLLTFDKGTGDSPDDWYVVYATQEEHLLAGMAYIVTYRTAKKDAEKDPHAITYEAYTDVQGIPISTQWNFWSWNESGDLNRLLGSGVISQVEFKKVEEDLFKPSSNLILAKK